MYIFTTKLYLIQNYNPCMLYNHNKKNNVYIFKDHVYTHKKPESNSQKLNIQYSNKISQYQQIQDKSKKGKKKA